MKLSPLTLAAVFLAAGASLAQAAPHPAARASTADTKKGMLGSYRLDFDHSGTLKDKMLLTSTGSKALDEKMLGVIGGNVTGPRGGSITGFIGGGPVQVLAPHGEVTVVVALVDPSYPYQARQLRLQGTGSVRVSFDESGDAVSATITRSTGSKILDENTTQWVRHAWKTTGGARS